MPSRTPRSNIHRNAFTLIELLVVIAIISLLIGILLPAIGAARDTARTVVCQSMMRSIAQLQFQYSLDNEDFFASPNTSSLPFNRVGGPAGGAGWNNLHFDTTPTTPTTIVDWMSPILGDSVNLSSNRAQRTAQLFNDYGCAAATLLNDTVYRPLSNPDGEQFISTNETDGYRQISYLAPESIYYHSSIAAASGPAPGGGVQFYLTHSGRQAIIPRAYRQKVTMLGTVPGDKVMFADGTRFASRVEGLDFDPAVRGTFGSFTEQNPIDTGSTAYSPTPFNQTVLTPTNVQLSYRHGDRMNIAKWDASVSTITREESYTNPNRWWPTGSVWNGIQATDQATAFMEDQQGDRDEARIY